MRLIDGLGASRSFVDLLQQLEADDPGRPVLRYRSGDGVIDVSATELALLARAYANGLRAAGALPGDRVAFLLSNGVDAAAMWFASGLAGVVEVPVNTDQRGPVLRHVLTDCEPALVVAEPAFVDQIEACGYEGPARVMAWHEQGRGEFLSAAETAYADPEPGSLATIMYTSGTTGSSKGVMLTHGYFANIGHFLRVVEPEFSAEDVVYVCTPMFHIDARLMMSAALVHQAVFSFSPRFGVSSFWEDVRDFRASFFVFVGAMVSILAKRTTEEMMRGTRLRSSIGGPTPPEAYAFFEDRHGIRLMEGYGMTECDGVVWSTPDRRRPGSVGWESGPYEVRVLSRTGQQLPAGEVGEIAIRPGAPNLITIGYWRQPDATIGAFRDLWFHTGDLGRYDEDGFLWFLGRDKEVIRRRGENVSTFEVESTLLSAPGVLECAAVGVPDELGGEEEILLFVVPNEGTAADPVAVFTYAETKLARFAVPRYIRFMAQLPHTPTGKVEKHRLLASVDEETHDRMKIQGALPQSSGH